MNNKIFITNSKIISDNDLLNEMQHNYQEIGKKSDYFYQLSRKFDNNESIVKIPYVENYKGIHYYEAPIIISLFIFLISYFFIKKLKEYFEIYFPSLIIFVISFISLSYFIFISYDLNKKINDEMISKFIIDDKLIQYKRKYNKECYKILIKNIKNNKIKIKYDLFIDIKLYNQCYLNT